MEIIRDQPQISSKDLAAQLKASDRTIWRDLSELTERGIIRYEGAKKTGRWVILSSTNHNTE